MRLPDFIRSNVEAILVDWEDFARSVWPADAVADPVELRDHAEEIVRAVLDDMTQAQLPGEQSEKSMGRGSSGRQSDQLDDASSIHGISRVAVGLPLSELIAEYRALRASVLRLWRNSKPTANADDLADVTRFNEAVDRSLTRAVRSFTERLNESRQMFLAILGHDLRTPLSAITLCAKLAQGAESADEQAKLLATVVSSGNVINELITDLIDFTSTSLGVQLPINLEMTDLSGLCGGVMNETRAANPGREVRCVMKGDLSGRWDAHRLRQVVANLLGNAIQHGTPHEPVTLTLDGTDADSVTIAVHNHGDPIPAAVLPTVFDPLVRSRTAVEKRTKPGSIGLGLYIAREITLAHHGTIALTSTAADGTTAVVRLPR